MRSEHTWRGLLDYRVLSIVLVVTMAWLYWAFSSTVTYYPVSGQVTLNGRPVVGAKVILDTDDDTLDAALTTGLDGRYRFATDQRAGGAPAGTPYRVRIIPDRDYLVRRTDGAVEVLAWMPAGTDVERRDRDGKTIFLLETQPEPQTVEVAAGANVEVLRATAIPPRYRDFASSGLAFAVAAEAQQRDFPLQGDPVAAGQ